MRKKLLRTRATGLTLSDPKTDAGIRFITLPKLAIKALKEHRERQMKEKEQKGSAWQDTNLVFCNTIGKPLERQNVMRRSFKPLLAKAGLPDATFHSLRTTSASLLLKLGVPETLIQERLGHADLEVTRGFYLKGDSEQHREVADKIDELLTGLLDEKD